MDTPDDVATTLAARNTPVPVKRSEIFTTAADMQTTVSVRLLQGERTLADYGEKISEKPKKRIKSAVVERKDAVGKNEADQAVQKAEALKTVLQEAGEAVHA